MSNQRYLVVHTYIESPSATYCYIRGQIFKADGVPLTGEFEIREAAQNISNCGQPAVAFDSRSQRYLVVWRDDRNATGGDVYGKLVNAAGVPINPAGAAATVDIQFAAGANAQSQPSVACDPRGAVGKFLVAWNDNNDDIRGRFMAANAEPGLVVTICDAASSQKWPAVAFDQTSGKFLVAWEDERAGATTKIWARTCLNEIWASEFAACVSAGYQTSPHLTCAPTGAKFLMVYCDGSSTGNNMGQFVSAATDSASGVPFPISQGGSSVSSGRAASLAWGTDRYLVTWVDNRNTTEAVYGQYFDAAGILIGAAFAVGATGSAQANPVVAGNSENGVFLAGFDYKTSTTSKELKLLLLNVPEPEASEGSSGGSGCFVTSAGGSIPGVLVLLAGLLTVLGFRRPR